jgi:hypothetical protein
MPPYEPKIDSREFELANLERSNLEQSNLDQSTGTRSRDASGDGGTDVAIRIWSAEGAAGLTWKSESVLVCMMADLVGASRGRIAEESPTMMAAHFDSSRLAVVAAKRIQTAMLEFVDCRPSEPIASAIVIYQPRATEPTGLSGEMVQMELGQAKPGQILLGESIAQRLRDLPGIELVSASVIGASGDGPGGLPELVWTTAERLARLRDSVGAMRSAEGPAAGATRIMDSPYALRSALNKGALNEVMLNEAVPPVEGSNQFAARERGDDRGAGAITQNFRQSSGESLTGMEFEEQPFLTRTRVLLGVAALVLGAAVIAILLRPPNDSKGRVPQTQEQTGAAQGAEQKTPDAGESRDQKPQGESKTEQSLSNPIPSKPAANKPVVVVAPPSSKTTDNRARKRNEVGAATTEAVPEVPSDFGGLTAKDIPKLLELAKKDAGAGLYEKARGEYQNVLRLKPGDADAMEGLRRIKIALESKDQ